MESSQYSALHALRKGVVFVDSHSSPTLPVAESEGTKNVTPLPSLPNPSLIGPNGGAAFLFQQTFRVMRSCHRVYGADS